MWESFLQDVDTVMKAALAPEEWERMKVEDQVQVNRGQP